MSNLDNENEEQLEETNEEIVANEELSEIENTLEADAEEDVEGESVADTELESFESEEIEQKEFVDADSVISIVESVLFSSPKPTSFASLKQIFKGTNVTSKQIKAAVDDLRSEYASPLRGVSVEEVGGGYQLRTKIDNKEFLKRSIKARPFKLSGPALEVLSIIAYKQPCIKHAVDEIRGVESGHLLRGLMDKSIVSFTGKSELPGKPMLYATTKKFLEIFGLRNLKELPSLSEIDELIPEGIEAADLEEKKTLDQLTESLSESSDVSYSQNEDELEKIAGKLSEISTSTEFFEQEKQRLQDKKDAEKAQDLKDALMMDEEISVRDRNWLERYEAKQLEAAGAVEDSETQVDEALADEAHEDVETLAEEIADPDRVNSAFEAASEALSEFDVESETPESKESADEETEF
ncbi:SMC-Scp complex subunit ScpB [bacterium]|nr:SMC-Scp complex subunit ScpB [bacterium]